MTPSPVALRSLAPWLLCLALWLPATAAPGQDTLPGLPGAPAEDAPAEEAAAEDDDGPAPETALSDGPIAVETDAAQDERIRRRLEQIFSVVGDLSDVQVRVDAGVVRLSGEVLGAEPVDQAVRLARQVEGVVAVENELTEVRDLDRRLAPAWTKLRDRVVGWVQSLPLLAVALVVFLVFWFAARWLSNRQGLYRHITRNQFLQELARQVVRAAVVIVGALLALEILDATALVGAVLGTAGVVGLALGFAFKDTAENYIASILLSVRQPFAPHDHVVVEGHEGRVARLTSRATILLTLDGNHVRIPNSQVFKGIVVNYTRNPERRFSFEVGVGTDEVLADVQRVGIETLTEMPGVLTEPPPEARIEQLGDSNVVVKLFGWVDQRQADFRKVRSEAIRRVKEAYDRAGFFMPEPIYRIKADWVESFGEGGQEAAAPKPPASARDRATPKPPPAETEPAVDLSPDRHLDRQVAEDRAEAGSEDLLDPEAPLE